MKQALNACIIAYTTTLFSCTGIFLETENNSYVHARTLEFGKDLQSQILVIPRNYEFRAQTPDNKKNGLRWKSRYAAVGINAYQSLNFIDGVNEVGLSGGLFYFPGFAHYQEVPPEQMYKSLPMWQLLTFILTRLKSVEEVKRILPKLLISKAALQGAGEITPAHLIIHDTHGKSVVVEYIDGHLHMHDNPLGVITNAPSFDWHMTNLRNYINLTPYNAPIQRMSTLQLSQLGQGSGMLGLPGDFTPPSRFVRAVAFQNATPKAKTEEEAVYQAFHILNNFDIPQGAARTRNGAYDYTQWTSAIDMANKIFYWRTHAAFQIQKIELMRCDLDSKNARKMPLVRPDTIIDRTPLPVVKK